MRDRTMKTSRAICTACVALLAGAATLSHAQSDELYVIEQLIIGVSAAPDSTGERVASIRSGDRVEVLERQGEYVRVKLRTGAEGWVKGGYLSAEPPLRVQLDEQTKALEAARAQATRLESALAAARSAATPAAEQASGSMPSTVTFTATAESANSMDSNAPLLSPRLRAHMAIWPWMLGSSALALGAGFVLGWRMLDRRIRRKYGGLRIY